MGLSPDKHGEHPKKTPLSAGNFAAILTEAQGNRLFIAITAYSTINSSAKVG
jgi:hypothetical protein